MSITRDIIFHERHFPCHLSSKTASPPLSFLPISTDYPTLPHEAIPNIFAHTTLVTNPPSDSHNTPPHTTTSQCFTPHSNTYTPPSHPIRKITRIIRPPAHLNDFICNNSSHSTLTSDHWCNLVTFPRFQQLCTV